MRARGPSGKGPGIMASRRDEGMPCVVTRRQFLPPIGAFGPMQGRIADMHAAVNSGRTHVHVLAAACVRGQMTRQDAAAAVLYASEQAMRQAVEATGGAAFVNDAAAARLFRDARPMENGAGSSGTRGLPVGRGGGVRGVRAGLSGLYHPATAERRATP